MERSDHDGDLAVLEAALEEEVGGMRPPDLWHRIRARRDGRGDGRDRHRWSAAALVGIGAAVLLAVFALRSGGDAGRDGPDPAAPPRDPQGPRSLQQARSWLRSGEVGTVTLLADAVIDAASGARVPLFRDTVERLFAADRFAIHGRDERAAVVAAVAAAAPAHQEWRRGGEYTLRITCGAHRLDVHVRGCSRFPPGDPARATLSFAIAGRDGPLPITPPVILTEILDVGRLVELSTRTREARGVAVGDAGLRALPPSTARVRCHGVTAAAVAELLRFDRLQSLDLQFSPALHRPDALGTIARLPLRSLVVAGAEVDGAAVAVLGTMASLRELFFFDPAVGLTRQALASGGAAAIDDATVAHLAGLQELQELAISGAAITDAGLRTLAQLPALERLSVAHCARLGGEGLDAFAAGRLRGLSIVGCRRITPRGVAAIAQLATLDELMVEADGSDLLAGLGASTSIEELFVEGDPGSEALAVFAGMSGLRKLTVRNATSLRDRDLGPLHLATALQRIELVGCPAVTDAELARLRRALPECRVGRDEW